MSSIVSWRRFRVWFSLFLLAVGLSGLTAACQFQATLPDGRPAEVNLTLSSFAVTKKAHEAIMPLFAAQWEREHQQKVRFRTTYGPSGRQSRAVIDGLEADIVHLSLGLDVDRIAKAGLVRADWSSQAPPQQHCHHFCLCPNYARGQPQKSANMARPTS